MAKLSSAALHGAVQEALDKSLLGSLSRKKQHELLLGSRLLPVEEREYFAIGEMCPWLLVDGLAHACLLAKDGRQVTIRTATVGDMLGIAFIAGGSLPVIGQALRDSWVLLFDSQTLKDRSRRDSEVCWLFLGELSKALSHGIDEVATNAFGTVRERLLRRLVELVPGHSAGNVTVRVTQQELADSIGSAREVVGRTLREIEKSGFIQVQRSHIRIDSVDILRRETD